MTEFEFFMQQAAREKADRLARIKHLNPLAKKGQIVFAGSSLMEQFPINEMIQNMDVTIPYAIYNRGIGGYTIPELLEVMDDCIFDLEPKYLVINIGTNDLSAMDFDMDVFISRYREVLTQIKNRLPETKVSMLAYYPMSVEVGMNIPWMRDVLTRRDNKRIAAANEAVKKLAAEMGNEYLDLNAGLYDERGELKPEFTIEGMHMYANGYAEVLKELLRQWKPSC